MVGEEEVTITGNINDLPESAGENASLSQKGNFEPSPHLTSLKVFTCVDHDGHWVGVASVVVAGSEEAARQLLQVELRSHGLSGNKPFSLREINVAEPRAFVLQDGDY